MTHESKGDGATFEPVDYSAWHDRVASELDGADPADVLSTRLVGGLNVRPLYTRENAIPLSHRDHFDRRPPGWCIGQSYCTDDPEMLAAAIAEDQAGGVQGFTLDVDRLSSDGSDDQPSASSPPRLEQLLTNLFDARRGTVDYLILQSGAPPAQIAEGMSGWLGRMEVAEAPRVGLGIDPVASAAAMGSFPARREAIGKQMRLALERSRGHHGRLRAFTVATHVYEQAGADAGLELAVALSTAVEYLRLLEDEGVNPSEAVAHLVFRFALGKDMFCDIAKLRVLRSLWRHIIGMCGIDSAPSPWIDAKTSPRVLTADDTETNLLRSCNAAVAAVIGGADTISCAPYDLLHESPSDRGRRLARNTQLILREESHLGRVVDPAAGCFYIEALGRDLAQQAWNRFRRIESRGGIWGVLGTGELQQELEDLWQERRARFADHTDPITGISLYAKPSVPKSPRSLGKPTDSGSSRPPRWPDLERGPEIPPISRHRDSEDYEELIAYSDRITGRIGSRPKVFLVPRPNESAAREAVSFARNLFAAGGFEVVTDFDLFREREGEAAPGGEISLHNSIVCVCLGPEITDVTSESGDVIAGCSSDTRLVALSVTLSKADLEIPERIETLITPGVDAIAVLRRALDFVADGAGTRGTG